jgi:hypothetical protein
MQSAGEGMVGHAGHDWSMCKVPSPPTRSHAEQLVEQRLER